MSITVTNVSKIYQSQKALDTISFSAKKGQIIGFLGPNGAGKSTMMKILTGYIKPTEGEALINNIDVLKNPLDAQKNIGYLPEHNPMYKELYVREYLMFCADIHKIKKKTERINEVITQVGLTLEVHKKINQLSKGYQQRVGLAAAILHNPAVLILDEPTTGLDPNQLVEIRQLIKELGAKKTILFSTHIMQEVEALAEHIIIINKGQLVLDKPLIALKENKHQIIKVTFKNIVQKETLLQLDNLETLQSKDSLLWILKFSTTNDMRGRIFDFAKENKLQILELSAETQNLESLFRELTM